MNAIDEGSAIEAQTEQSRKDKALNVRVCKGIAITIDSQWDSARGGNTIKFMFYMTRLVTPSLRP